MTIIDDKLDIDRTPARTAATYVPTPAGRPRKRGTLAAVAAIVVAVGLAIGLAVQIAAWTDQNDQPRPASPPDADTDVVVGTGPHSVFVGSAPRFGGDPARGETDESYFARTGRHLPSRVSQGDDYIRDLVARGVVPAASLDDGTRIESGEATD
jgi:hypothetical protein